jgi:hypothetical protein
MLRTGGDNEKPAIFSDRFTTISFNERNAGAVGININVQTQSENTIWCTFGANNITTLAEANAWLAENNTTVMYALPAPKYINLSEINPDALAQYAALHTNYPNTTVFNDGGAGMEVKYVADTKGYVDKVAPSEGEYELIETIVCDGTFGNISRLKLSLKKAKVLLNMKAASAAASGGIEAKNEAGMFGYSWIGNMINTGERFSSAYFVSDGKDAYAELIAPAAGTNYVSALNRTVWHQNADTPINRINVYVSGGCLLPAGSTIEIWGVRA